MKLPGFERVLHGATEAQLDGTELILGFRFPAAYRNLMASFGGAYGDAEFPLQGGVTPWAIGNWLSLLPWDSESLWSSLSTWSEHKLPRTIVPFGSDGGGNYICFDYANGPVTPSIVLWHHELEGEDGLEGVAPSFEEFLMSLHDPKA